MSRGCMLVVGCVVSFVAVAGCGHPLVDSEYRGRPIFVVEGYVNYSAPTQTVPEDAPLRTSLFWTDEINAQSLADLKEHRSVTATFSFPNAFRIRVFEPPFDASGTGEWPNVFSLVLVYLDQDGDGSYDLNRESLVGGALNKAVVYSVLSSKTGNAVGQYSVVALPLVEGCLAEPSAQLPTQRPADDDAVPKVDAPQTLEEVPEPSATESLEPVPDRPWVGQCFSDVECPAGLACESTNHICIPAEPFLLEAAEGFSIERPFCGKAPR